jgi:hypothetical protein
LPEARLDGGNRENEPFRPSALMQEMHPNLGFVWPEKALRALDVLYNEQNKA